VLYSDQRQEMVDAVGLLVRAGVMSHTGHINLSCRLDQERMLLSGVGLVHDVRSDTLAVVSLDGQVEVGALDNSSREIVGMHAAVYRSRPAAGAVIHTHSPHVTAFALARKPLPSRYEALTRRGQVEPVPVVPWGARGSTAAHEGIAAVFGRQPNTLAVLLSNHGLLASGPSPTEAARLVIVLEEAAEAELKAVALGGAQDIPVRSGTIAGQPDLPGAR